MANDGHIDSLQNPTKVHLHYSCYKAENSLPDLSAEKPASMHVPYDSMYFFTHVFVILQHLCRAMGKLFILAS